MAVIPSYGHMRHTLTFNLFVGATQEDIAEFTFWTQVQDYSSGPITWDEACQSAADGVWDAWAAHGTPDYFHSNVRLLNVKSARMDLAGKTQNEGQSTGGDAWVGTASSTSLPWQVSMAVSLYSYTPGTFISNARRRRGRFYLPPPSAIALAGDGSGLLAAATVTDVLGSMHDFLEAVAAVQDSGGDALGLLPVVYSREAGQDYAVTDLAMDTRADSQRRRANRQVGTRSVVAL